MFAKKNIFFANNKNVINKKYTEKKNLLKNFRQKNNCLKNFNKRNFLTKIFAQNIFFTNKKFFLPKTKNFPKTDFSK